MEDMPENNQQKEDLMNTMELDRDQEMTPSEVGTKDHELQDILDREHLDLEKFLELGTIKGMDSLPQEEFNRVQQLFLWRTEEKGTGVKRNHDSYYNGGIKTMEAIEEQDPKNPGRKRGRKRQNELLIDCGKLMINSDKIKDLTSYSFTNLS